MTKTIIGSALVLASVAGAATAQPPPAPGVPGVGVIAGGNPSDTLAPEEAARRALQLCIDHSIGTALIAPAAAEQLKGKDFQLSDEKSPSEIRGYSGYTALILTSKGPVKAYASQRGHCEVTATDTVHATVQKALMSIFEKPKTFEPRPSSPDLPDNMQESFSWHWSRPGQDLNARMTVYRDSTVSARIIKSSDLPGEPH